MASLETHYCVYRLVFRYGGRKFKRSLKTDKERTALAAAARADETLERAQQIAAHSSAKTTKLYDRRNDEITLDEIERIQI